MEEEGFSLFRAAASVYLRQTGTRLFGFNGYGFLYVYTEPLLWVLYFLLVVELDSLILEDFPGIRRLGHWVMLRVWAPQPWPVARSCSWTSQPVLSITRSLPV